MIKAENLGKGRIELTFAPGEIKTFTDAPAAHGGYGEYPTPVALFAESLAACALTTLGMAAQQGGIDAAGLKAEVTDIVMDEETHSVAAVAITFHLPASIDAKMRKRLEAFTHRACTVGNSIKAEEKFTFLYE